MDLSTEDQGKVYKCNSRDLTTKNQMDPGSMRPEEEDGNNNDSLESDTAMDVWDQKEAENIEAYKLDLLSRRPYLKEWQVLDKILLGDLPSEDRKEASCPMRMEGEVILCVLSRHKQSPIYLTTFFCLAVLQQKMLGTTKQMKQCPP